MFQFFITESDLTYDGAGTPCGVEITGADKNHMKNALRMHVGEEFLVCVEDTDGVTYRCRVAEFLPDVVRCEILAGVEECTELPCRITLYQGLAKGDKMETVIQKAVELGAARIVPVITDRVIVKLDDKKKDKKKEQAKAQDRGERTKFNATISSETAQTSTQRRTVDTRGSYVDLDKYNERYDQMATSNKHKNDNYSSKKQKINQKSAQRNRQQFSKKESEAEKLKRLELERARKQQLKVLIPDTITVGELATRLKAAATEVIKQLMKLGVMASINQEIDFDTASLVALPLRSVLSTIPTMMIQTSSPAALL